MATYSPVAPGQEKNRSFPQHDKIENFELKKRKVAR